MPPLNPRKRWWADPSPDESSKEDTILTCDAPPLFRAGASNVRDTYQSLLVGRQGSYPVSSILSPVFQYQRRISGSAYAPATPQYLSKLSVGFKGSPPHSARKKIRVARSIIPTAPPSNLEHLQGHQLQLFSIGENRSINSVSHTEQGPTQDRYAQANRVNSPPNAISTRKWTTGSAHPLGQLSSGGKHFLNSIENTPTLPPAHHAKLPPRSPRPVPGSQKGTMGFGTSGKKVPLPAVSSVNKHETYGNQTVLPLPQIIFHDREPLFVAPIQPMLRNYADNSSSLVPRLSQTKNKSSFAVVIPVPSRSIAQHVSAATGPCREIGAAVLRQSQKGSGSTGSYRRSPRLNPGKFDPKFQTLAAKNTSAVDIITPSDRIPVAENHKASLLSLGTSVIPLKSPRSDMKSLIFHKKAVGAANRTDSMSSRPLFEITTHCCERKADPQRRKHTFEVVIWSRPQSGIKAQEGHSVLNVPNQSHPKTPLTHLRGLTYEQRTLPKELETVHFAQTAEDKKIAVPAVPSARYQGPQIIGGSGFRWQFNMPRSSQEAQNRFITNARASTKNQGSTTPWIPRQRRIENSPFRGLKIVTSTATPPMGPLGRLPMGNAHFLMPSNNRQATSNSYLRTPTMARPRGATSLRSRKSRRPALPNTPRPIIVPLPWSARSYAAGASAASPEVSPSIRGRARDWALVDLAQNYQGNPSFNGDAGSSKSN